MEDSESCLKLDTQNLKARLRLAEASYASGRRREVMLRLINIQSQQIHFDPPFPE